MRYITPPLLPGRERNGAPSKMKRAFEIFKRDVLRLLRNPVAMVIVVGVCVIPSLYAWYNIVANWDPYGNTAGVKIAVADNDAGVSNELVGEMNAGADVVTELKGNHDLGWTFVDEHEAVEGVKRGEYYAAIVVPKDFSANLVSMFTGSYTEPKLGYYVNEKTNAIAPKVTDTGAKTIEEKINETFVATVTETLVAHAQELSRALGVKGDAATGELLSGLDRACAVLDEVHSSITGMGDGVMLAKKTLGAADSTLGGLKDGLPTLSNALSASSSLLHDTRVAGGSFAASLNTAVSQASGHLASASAKANQAIGELMGVVGGAKTKVDLALADVQGLIDANNRVLDALDALIDQPGIQHVLDRLRALNDELTAKHDALAAQSAALGADLEHLKQAADGVNGAIQDGSGIVVDTGNNLNTTVLPQLTQGLDSFAQVSGDLSGIVDGFAPAIGQARSVLNQLSSTLDQASVTLGQVGSSLEATRKHLGSVRTDVASLQSSDLLGEVSRLSGASPADAAKLMSSPVTLDTQTVYPVATYGSGVSPFYTNLALWVGGFVLIAIFKLEVDGEGVGDFTPAQGYFGRWLLMVSLGAIQAIIVCVGDLVLGMQCANPLLFVLAGVFASFVYVNIIYALASAFKHVGKALAVVMVIVQIPGSSGLYPIEMMPQVFQTIHPLLPFTYSIAAMRECVGGFYGAAYVQNLAVLLIFLAVALVLGVGLRPWLLNLNALFDRHLASTSVMICERNAMERPHVSLKHMVAALLDSSGYRASTAARARRFEHRYPKLVRAGWAAMVIVPVALVIASSVLRVDVDGKIALLLIWIASMVAIVAYLIALEYIRESLGGQMRIAAMSEQQLKDDLATRKKRA